MFEIDRIAAIIKPTKEMLNWLQKQSPEYADLTMNDLRGDCTALLIPAFEEPEVAQQYIEEIYSGIFENELELWNIDEEHWPQDRSVELFSSWFEVEFHSLVIDIGDIEEMEKEVYSDRLQ